MLENLDWKLVLAIFTVILVVIGYVPYVKDIFANKTKPHLYTWLIWLITQGTATVALIYGGGKFGSLGLIVGTVLVLVICGLSFRYGTKNITKGDTITLFFALLAILVWWQLDNPLLAIFMVSAIDGLGYIPTVRKTWEDPSSETTFFWVVMAIVNVLTLLANAEHNFLTMTYSIVLGIGNAVMVFVIKSRRKALLSTDNLIPR